MPTGNNFILFYSGLAYASRKQPTLVYSWLAYANWEYPHLVRIPDWYMPAGNNKLIRGGPINSSAGYAIHELPTPVRNTLKYTVFVNGIRNS
jgi:hypothetical protein